MKINDIINGFRVKSSITHNELGGTLWKLEHIKTGGELVWLDNGEDNKLFSITFKTIPWDDTGVFHILEHSVLCGSENFPVKEPFLDMLKGSMNTFLNAMTFPDKTMYPVSSRNEQDFMNLCSVYLDAVFCPAIYTNPCIFKQEGWHYELGEGEITPTYKGVVFNEMKGAYSSVDSVVDNEICKLLFPNNCYKYSSGGDPKSIPDLTYENFLRAHRDFYNPSNSRTYLDGALPIERVLELINYYFEKFERIDIDHDIALQSPISAIEAEAYYEIGKEENESFKVQFALGKLLCDWSEKKKIFAAEVLSSYLTGSNASPLKRAILEDGLAQDAWIAVNSGMAQTYTVLRIRNTESENTDKIREKIRGVAEQLLRDGLDKEELEANINYLEFMLKETEEPKAIDRAISAMNAWLYGGEAEEYLIFEDVIASLRAELETNYFEALLREMLLDDEHTAALTVLPSKTKGDEVRAEEMKRLSDESANWSDKKREEIRADNAALESWQMSEDSPEALATLPKLSISDISNEPEMVKTEISDIDGVRMLYHPVATNGVVHATLFFSISDIGFENLSALSFLSSLFDELPTKAYSVTELQKQIKKNIGYLDFDVRTYVLPNVTDKCKLFFAVSFGVLEKNLEKGTKIVIEILKNTMFDDFAAIRECLLQRCEDKYHSLIRNGHARAKSRAYRNLSAVSAVEEKLSGYDMYRYLKDFSDDFDNKIEEFSVFAKDFAEKMFVSSRLIISETATDMHSALEGVVSLLGEGGNKQASEQMEVAVSGESVKEAIQIPSGVSYAALCANIARYGEGYSGRLAVLGGILSYGYLWTEIRVRGGAYGCGFRAGRSGSLDYSTYRDPSPLRSLDIFRKTSEFITELVQSDEDIERYIISSVSSSDPLRSAAQKGAVADAEYFCEVSYEYKKARRGEMLSLKKSDLLELCPLFKKVAENGSVCIVAHEAIVSELDDSWTVYKL